MEVYVPIGASPEDDGRRRKQVVELRCWEFRVLFGWGRMTLWQLCWWQHHQIQ